MKRCISAAAFALSTALAAPAYSVETDGTICLHMAVQKHKARQALWQDIPELEKRLKDSQECAEVDVEVAYKGRYGRETAGEITCYRGNGIIAHQYDLAGVDSVAVVSQNKVEVSLEAAFKDGKKKSHLQYTLPDADRAKKAQEAFQKVMNHYWTLKS